MSITLQRNTLPPLSEITKQLKPVSGIGSVGGMDATYQYNPPTPPDLPQYGSPTAADAELQNLSSLPQHQLSNIMIRTSPDITSKLPSIAELTPPMESAMCTASLMASSGRVSSPEVSVSSASPPPSIDDVMMTEVPLSSIVEIAAASSMITPNEQQQPQQQQQQQQQMKPEYDVQDQKLYLPTPTYTTLEQQYTTHSAPSYTSVPNSSVFTTVSDLTQMAAIPTYTAVTNSSYTTDVFQSNTLCSSTYNTSKENQDLMYSDTFMNLDDQNLLMDISMNMQELVTGSIDSSMQTTDLNSSSQDTLSQVYSNAVSSIVISPDTNNVTALGQSPNYSDTLSLLKRNYDQMACPSGPSSVDASCQTGTDGHTEKSALSMRGTASATKAALSAKVKQRRSSSSSSLMTSSAAPSTSSSSAKTTHCTPILPPCRVCADKATGFHYGTNTCEACKGFFRRSLLKGHTYVCANNKNCGTTGPHKAACAYCRLQKCIAVGMSKQGIKRGRYSLEKKTNFIKEVKRIQHQEKIQKRLEHLNSLEERKHEIEQLIQYVSELSLKFTAYSPEFVETIPEKQKKHMEKKRLREKIFNRMKKTKPEDYKELYKPTDDLEGRKGALQNHFEQMETGIQRFVSFCKGLPGFLKLPQEDQVALVKASLHKARTLSAHLAVNEHHDIFTNTNGETVEKADLVEILNEELADEFFRSAKAVKRANLSREEMALLSAICVYSGDECPMLKAPEKVDELQQAFVEALQHHISHNQKSETDGAQRLGRLLMLLSEIRYADYIHWKHREDMFAKLYGLQVPPLVLEIIMG